MFRARTLIGALVLSALALCLLGAASASAEGLTAVICEEVEEPGTGKFKDSHCEEAEAGGNFKTVKITELATTEAEGDAKETSVLHTTLFGASITFTCQSAHTTGRLTNTIEAGSGERRVHGTEVEVDYSECEAHLSSKSGTEEACQIENLSGTSGIGNKGTITTEPLTATTGKEHQVTFSNAGGNLAKFKTIKEGVTGLPCSIPGITVTVTGTAIATANTTKHSHLTFEGKGELKADGGSASYTGTHNGYMAAQPENTISLETF